LRTKKKKWGSDTCIETGCLLNAYKNMFICLFNAEDHVGISAVGKSHQDEPFKQAV
jgi:hypothetical protein